MSKRVFNHAWDVARKSLNCFLAALLAMVMVPGVSFAAIESEQSGGAVYRQLDGYEPYTGWQDAPWQEAGDPQYDSQGGTARKGWPAWSLCDPLSLGVDDYKNALVTGESVMVVEDTAAEAGCVDPRDATYENPTYYKNIILDPYDVSDADGVTSFTFSSVAPGGSGLDGTKVLALAGSGFVVATSPDSATWDANAEGSSVVWTAAATDIACSMVRDNWWQYITVRVPNSVLSADQTYYLGIKNGTASGWGRIYANIAFQFTTGGEAATWSGDLTGAAYGREQGNGGTKIGFMSPEPTEITTDLTVANAYRNNLVTPVELDEDGLVNFVVHADGSGSNWQNLDGWTSATGACGTNVYVYGSDPLRADGSLDASLTPVCSMAQGNLNFALVNPDRDWPGRDGVRISAAGLQAGGTYYLAFSKEFKPNNQTNPLGKVLVLAFSIASENSWDVSEAQDGSVVGTLVDNASGADDEAVATTYTLSFQGSGAIRDFASAADAPYASVADRITNVVVGDGVTTLGSYSCALPNVVSFRGGASLTAISANAFSAVGNLVELDFTSSVLSQVDEAAFGFETAEGQEAPKRTIYVGDAASATAVQPALAQHTSSVALAVTNGGRLAPEHEVVAGALVDPRLEGYTFSTWTSDEYLMHPASAWAPLSKYVLYARFVEVADVDEPEPYEGRQGLDQTVTLYDPALLPSTTVHGGILFLGEDETSYQNQFQAAFAGDQDICFAFGMGRGSNANGGDGSYQLSFALPHIAVVNQEGTTVASYDNGNGLLRLAGIVFDGKMDQTTGYTIYAVRLSVAAGTLEPGTYTLRFASTMGSNNGISFLGKDVDFQFEVVYPERYQLAYSFDSAAKTATVTGVSVTGDQAVNVVLPEVVEGPDGETYRVVAVGESAFAGQPLVASVDVPSSVVSIGARAFAQMEALEKVTVRAQGAADAPTWGARAFEESAYCVLYGYEKSSCRGAANLYDNVTFAPLDDGIYANHVLVSAGQTIEMSPDANSVEFTVMEGGRDVTNQYRGALTNNRVAGHEGTSPFVWNDIWGLRNGSTDVQIVDLGGEPKATVALVCQGFPEDASLESSVLTTYQGNGSTVILLDAGTVTTVDYDETLARFTNTIEGPVPAVGATFTLDIAGPGSAWGPGHSGWNWAGFVANVEANLRIEDAEGAVVATIGDGLSWRTLTTSNTITVAVDDGVLKDGQEYRLVAGGGFSGHNAQATLMKAVEWSFTATKVDIGSAVVSDIEAQPYCDEPATPQVSVMLPGYEVSIWDDTAAEVVVEHGAARPLVEGVDFLVTYEDNDAPGIARAAVQGTGNFAGTVVKAFAFANLPAQKGDVNLNGRVNIVDAQIAYDVAAGVYADRPELGILYANADVVGTDGIVDAADAFAIQHAVVFGW